MREHGIRRGSNLDLYNPNELSILDESARKMNGLLEVLRVQGAKISLKNNVG